MDHHVLKGQATTNSMPAARRAVRMGVRCTCVHHESDMTMDNDNEKRQI